MNVELSLMPMDRLASWLIASSTGYEQARRKAGDSAEVAAEKARTSLQSSFPDGTPAPGHLVFDIVVTGSESTGTESTGTESTGTESTGTESTGTDSTGTESTGTVVGYLWIAPEAEGSDAWWVFDIGVDENHRGAGYGRAAMQLAEQAAAKHGAVTIGLNVFGYNAVARALYDSLGYETTAVQMRKPL
jgi:ribosomal protein S18 acetylase RimI-like enzyme